MKTLPSIDSRYRVPKPDADYDTEFEVQAFLYSALVEAGIDVRGEVKWTDPKTRETCRFDLVIYEHADAVRIIEVKARERMYPRKELEDTRQARRYRLFGVPVTFVYGMDEAQQLLDEVIRGSRTSGGCEYRRNSGDLR